MTTVVLRNFWTPIFSPFSDDNKPTGAQAYRDVLNLLLTAREAAGKMSEIFDVDHFGRCERLMC
jgi:hypothetical protein